MSLSEVRRAGTLLLGLAAEWAAHFCRGWRSWALPLIEKFQTELHRLRTPNLAEGFFRHLRRYLSRLPGCRDGAHCEQVLGCYVLAAEQMHV